ncbi:MAG: YraN family protein [Archangiaceae bacterium]|nr:YraN family protein [Archangiaceae bacterium]
MREQNRRAIGDEAEALAVEHLIRAGYRIRARNVPCRVGELDIVAEKGTMLVVVEVRMKSNDLAGDPAETVLSRKQRRVVMAAMYYLMSEGLERDVRFDVISVVGRGRNASLEHIENAFDAGF